MSINTDITTKMEFIGLSGIKISNAVIVSGVTETEQDHQFLDFLKKHGPIKRVSLVDDSSSEFYKNLIVEFASGQALESLQPLLPQKIAVPDDPSVIYEIKALSRVYTAKKGNNVTDRVLAELKELAKLSGIDVWQFVEVLKELISQLETMKPIATEPDAAHVETEALTLQPDTHKDPECHSQKSDTDSNVTDPNPNTCESCSDLIEDLRKQVASLQSQLTFYEKQGEIIDKSLPGRSEGREATRVDAEQDMSGRTRKEPRPWYCFHCGQNRHIAVSCSNPGNPALVAKKREQLRMQQRTWLAQKNRPKCERHVTVTDLDAREKLLSLVRTFTGKSPDSTENTVHTTPPGVRPVESHVDAQSVTNTPGVAKTPDKTDSTSEFTGLLEMTDSGLGLDTPPDSESTSDSSSVLSEQDSDQSDSDVESPTYEIIPQGSFFRRVQTSLKAVSY